MSTRVQYAFEDRTSTVTLSDPARGNGVDLQQVAELAAAIRRARADDAHVVVLRAEGKAFSVGGDLGGFAAADSLADYIDDLAEGLHRAILDLQGLDAVVVAAVQGAAAGAGFPLAAAADLLIAAESARFTMAYTKIGLTPDGGSSLLTATLGLHRTLQLALLNPVLSALEARQLGLVAQVVADDELDAAVGTVVAQLLASSRPALVAAKRLIRAQAIPTPESALRREAVSIREVAGTADVREGVHAFSLKRPPRFPSARQDLAGE